MIVKIIVSAGVDVRGKSGAGVVFARGPHLPPSQSLRLEDRHQRGEEERHQGGRSLDGRLQKVLLRTLRK